MPHMRMLASAGTGKTYQLTSRYLQLVLQGVDPATILATTFTRAAAAEIRDRILVTTAHAVLSEDRLAELGRRTGQPDLSGKAVQDLLSTLLQQLDRLQVCTLHSFFSRVAAAYSSELGLPASPSLLEDDEDRGLKERALARSFQESFEQGRDGEFLGALEGLTKGAADRSVTKAITKAVDDGLEAYFQARQSPGPWRAFACSRPSPFDVGGAIAKIRAHVEVREPDVITRNLLVLCTALEGFTEPIATLDLDAWDGMLKKGVALKIRSGESTFSRTEIDQDTIDLVQPMLHHLQQLATYEYAMRTGSTYYLVHAYAQARELIEREESLATFDDIVRCLAGEKDPLLRNDIWFRLDTSIQHLLLDEFQDTSLMEWNVLRPLACEIVSDSSGDRTFFCVGDVKQSIYGWRGGLPGILEELPALILDGGVEADLADRTLSCSHRSAPEVLEAVNEVFGDITRNDAISVKSQGAATGFARMWVDHETALGDLKGCVELRSVDPGDRKSASAVTDLLAVETARLVGELHRTNPALKIGILAPKNDMVSHVVQLLRSDHIEASGQGGGSFLDCDATIVCLDALRLAEYPSDGAAAFNVINSPLGQVLGLEEREQASEVSRTIRRSIARTGLARTIEDWVRRMSGSLDLRETARLERLVTEAQRIERTGERSPLRAAVMLEQTRLDEPGGDVIRGMSIHGSKGLAFDVVVMTGLESNLFMHPELATNRPMPPGDIQQIIRWMREGVRSPVLEGLHEQTRAEHVRERLCQLYVAMTRARRGLFMLVAPSPRKEPESMAGVLRSALTGLGDADPESGILARFGSASALALDDAPHDEVEPAVQARTLVIDVRTGTGLAGDGSAAPPSASHHAPAPRLVPAEAGTDPRLLGIAWHRLLEEIVFIEDGVPGRDELRGILEIELPGEGPEWYESCIDQFLEGLDAPQVREALSRELFESGAGSIHVHRELPVMTLTPEGRVQEGIVDRAVYKGDPGALEQVMIVDWKTDKVLDGAHAEHAERYREQLARYREAVALAAGLTPDRVHGRVVFVRDGVGVELFRK